MINLVHKIVHKFLLAGGKVIPELHFKRPGFTYSACGPFTNYCEKIKKFKGTCDIKHIYKNELNKVYFLYDAACCDLKI